MRLAPIILGACLALAGTAHAADYTATPADWQKAVAAASDGDRVIWVGDFPGLSISKRWAGSVTFDRTAATFKWTNLNGAAGIEFVGGVMVASEGRWCINGQSGKAADGSMLPVERITVRNAVCRGQAVQGEGGMMFRDGRDITIDRVVFMSTAGGLTLWRVDGFTVSNSTFTRLTGDAIDLGGATNGRIVYNSFSGSIDIAPNHPDYAQCLNPNTSYGPCRNVEFAYNVAHGFAQGPFANYAENVSVHDNSFALSQSNAVNLTGPGNRAWNNRVMTLPGADYQSRITIRGEGSSSCGNVVASYLRWAASIEPACSPAP